MEKNNRETGFLYEQAVGYYLQKQGCELLEYNYRCPLGEIDLIMMDGEYVVFCEIKYRRDRKKGGPLDAVDRRKQVRIIGGARHYLAVNRMTESPCRFDVIGIEGSKVCWIKNAFECA